MNLTSMTYQFWSKLGIIFLTWLVSLILYLQLAFMDPGIQPPRAADLKQNTLDEDIKINGIPYTTKFCQTCHIRRPPRTKHCNVCGICVRDFDHHCSFINSCIGERSRPVFFFYLMSLQTHCLLLVYFSLWDFKVGRLTHVTFSNMLLGLMSLDLLIFMFATCLWWYQLFLISKGLTQYELNSDEFGTSSNPFDHGCCKNFSNSLCPKSKKSVVHSRRYSINLETIERKDSMNFDPKDLLHTDSLTASNYTSNNSIGNKNGTLYWVNKQMQAQKEKVVVEGVELTDIDIDERKTEELSQVMLPQDEFSSETVHRRNTVGGYDSYASPPPRMKTVGVPSPGTNFAMGSGGSGGRKERRSKLDRMNTDPIE